MAVVMVTAIGRQCCWAPTVLAVFASARRRPQTAARVAGQDDYVSRVWLPCTPPPPHTSPSSTALPSAIPSQLATIRASRSRIKRRACR